MIANYGYRVQGNRAKASSRGLREALAKERFSFALAGFGFATAVWAAIFSLQPALLPLTAIPVLATARYRDRLAAAVAISATAISASLFARLPNLEIGVWHSCLFATALAGLYLLAEKNVVRASKSDPVTRFLAEARPAKGCDIVLECDGLGDIAAVYGVAAREHVIELLGRSIKQETHIDLAPNQVSPGEFHVFLPNVPAEKAAQIAERIRATFRRYAFDAGYGACLNLTSGTAFNNS